MKKDLPHGFSGQARKEAGYQIYRIQMGVDPKDWKPLSGVGTCVLEIRIHAENEYRILEVAGFDDALFILHAFAKKTAEDDHEWSSVGAKEIRAYFEREVLMKSEWKEGSENIFKDVVFSEQEAEYLMIRSRLMLEVDQFVKRSGLTQLEASKKLGITQPRLNDLLRGKIQKFSIDALVKMLSRIGVHVDVHVRAA